MAESLSFVKDENLIPINLYQLSCVNMVYYNDSTKINRTVARVDIMQKNTFTPVYCFLLAFLCIVLLVSCTRTLEVGRWQEIGKTATLEFCSNGTFNAVDDMGMAVSGKYTVDKDGKIRLEIKHKDSSNEIINGTLAVHGDELTYTSEDYKEVYKYKRAL